MENVVLVIHLILALGLIGIVLLQRSEGGGLGIGGGGGGASGRPASTALGKVTWLFAIAFIVTSLTLTIIAAKNSEGDSVIERLGTETNDDNGTKILGDDLLPPSDSDDPLTPPKSE
ncbi:MAG: preprotein translocase subunit SecG [Paracoccaceae bacterium]|jgi:preprotein translocase subunit SecG|nr:preprotein translocase subunit SecG [Paracoccaceae bacterium]